MAEPLRELLETDSVVGAYVFDPAGELLASGGRQSLPPHLDTGMIHSFVGYLAQEGRDVSECVILFPRGLLYFRRLEERVILLEGDAKAEASLLRMSVDVAHHKWREIGIQKVFPGKTSSGWRRFLRKRRGGS